MINKESLNKNWIKDIAKKHKSDPILVEKVIRALYLLETLQQTNLKFIFKGGTALMLMLPEPQRFSIDIDIIVPDKSQDIESNLDQVIANSDFIEYKLNERNAKSNIEKAHYKFYYNPNTSVGERSSSLYFNSVLAKRSNTLEITSTSSTISNNCPMSNSCLIISTSLSLPYGIPVVLGA